MEMSRKKRRRRRRRVLVPEEEIAGEGRRVCRSKGTEDLYEEMDSDSKDLGLEYIIKIGSYKANAKRRQDKTRKRETLFSR